MPCVCDRNCSNRRGAFFQNVHGSITPINRITCRPEPPVKRIKLCKSPTEQTSQRSGSESGQRDIEKGKFPADVQSAKSRRVPENKSAAAAAKSPACRARKRHSLVVISESRNNQPALPPTWSKHAKTLPFARQRYAPTCRASYLAPRAPPGYQQQRCTPDFAICVSGF